MEAEQLKQATLVDNVIYQQARPAEQQPPLPAAGRWRLTHICVQATAESTGLSAGSVDLVAVAQALHWCATEHCGFMHCFEGLKGSPASDLPSRGVPLRTCQHVLATALVQQNTTASAARHGLALLPCQHLRSSARQQCNSAGLFGRVWSPQLSGC